jgi:hypothetical protein
VRGSAGLTEGPLWPCRYRGVARPQLFAPPNLLAGAAWVEGKGQAGRLGQGGVGRAKGRRGHLAKAARVGVRGRRGHPL